MTFFGVFLEVAALWAYRKENTTAEGAVAEEQKVEAGARPPLDAPTAAPAGTV